MQLGKLVRDPGLLPPLPPKATVVQEAERSSRADFLLRRGRGALRATPAWQAHGADEGAEGAVTPLTELLAGQVASAASKMETLKTAMADASRTELVALDDASVDPSRRFKQTYMSLIGRTAEQMRATAIVSAGWTTLSADLTIDDDDLHSLVSRRLMMA